MEGSDLNFGDSTAPVASQEASQAHQPTQPSQGEGAGKPPAFDQGCMSTIASLTIGID